MSAAQKVFDIPELRNIIMLKKWITFKRLYLKHVYPTWNEKNGLKTIQHIIRTPKSLYHINDHEYGTLKCIWSICSRDEKIDEAPLMITDVTEDNHWDGLPNIGSFDIKKMRWYKQKYELKNMSLVDKNNYYIKVNAFKIQLRIQYENKLDDEYFYRLRKLNFIG